MKFRNKILIAIWGVVLGLIVVTLVIVNYWMRVQVEARFTDDVRGSYFTVHEISSLRAGQDIKSCQIIAETPRLKAVAELGDPNTALQLSREMNAGISSDLFILTDAKGKPLAELIGGTAVSSQAATFESTRRALLHESSADEWQIGGAVYRGASSPITVGGDIVGTLTIGFHVREEDVELIKAMTNSEVALTVDSSIVASTLVTADSAALDQWFRQAGKRYIPLDAQPNAEVFTIDASHDKYVAAICRLNHKASESAIAYLLVKPIEREVQASLAPVMKALLVLSLLVLAATGAIGYVISKSITRPIASLVQGTAEISKGNYDYHMNVRSGGELKFLASKFEEMSISLKEKVRQLADRNVDLETTLRRLIETEQRLQTILDTSSAIIYVKGLEGNYILINRRFETVYNCSRANAIGKTDYDLFPKEVADSFRANDVRAINTGKALEWEEAVPGEGGMRTYITNKFPLFDSKGAVYAVCSFSTDITDRKKLEEGLRQSQKMDSIGTLAGGIAHDFNNILSIILGYISRFERGKVNSENLTGSLEALRKATQRGADLVKQILTFARKTDVLLESVNVNQSVEELVKMLSETFPKTVTFTLNLDSTLPSIVADSGQIQQSLLNLCVNARDAMPNGGVLMIATRIAGSNTVRRKFTNAEDKSYACVEISDTGTGMDEATRVRIFEPFFTTKEIGRGTGLGLSVVFGIIQNHHGFIEVESAVGRGTTFRLYFPIPPGFRESAKEETKRMDEIVRGTETLLFVEDEEVLRELVKTSLQERGYNVIAAEDGIDAVNLFSQYKEKISLVICDMGLPKLGGWDVFKTMKEIQPDVRAIFASGYFDPAIKLEMIKGGAMDFIQKPYDPEEIVKQIRTALDGK